MKFKARRLLFSLVKDDRRECMFLRMKCKTFRSRAEYLRFTKDQSIIAIADADTERIVLCMVRGIRNETV